MKGKKKDYEFVSSFMDDCVKNNLFSQEEILNFARQEIKRIDLHLIESERLKKIRPKILDVIDLLGEEKIKDKVEYLNIFNIKNIELSNSICKILIDKDIHKNDISLISTDIYINSTIKDLLINKIIIIEDDIIKKGHNFNLFLKEVLNHE